MKFPKNGSRNHDKSFCHQFSIFPLVRSSGQFHRWWRSVICAPIFRVLRVFRGQLSRFLVNDCKFTSMISRFGDRYRSRMVSPLLDVTIARSRARTSGWY